MPSSMTRTGMMAVTVWAFTMTGVGGKAQANLVININQVGSDVVISGGGTVDLTGLTYLTTYTTTDPVHITPFTGYLVMGTVPETELLDVYSGVTGPASFGAGDSTYATSGAGDAFYVSGYQGYLAVPAGYTSNEPLSFTDTYANQTLNSLGVSVGTYIFTWGSDPITMDIGTAAVPEPSSAILAGIGAVSVVACFLVGKRREQRRQAAA